MQDGATCHTAEATGDYLNTLFGDQVISGKTSFAWSPNSPDLKLLDFFLWGYCKDNVSKNNPQTLEELKTEVENFILNNNPAHMQEGNEQLQYAGKPTDAERGVPH